MSERPDWVPGVVGTEVDRRRTLVTTTPTPEWQERVARSRARQGLPPTITDPEVLAKIERLVANDLPPIDPPAEKTKRRGRGVA